MLTRTARPSAPPIMNEVLTTPEASPDSCGSTSPIAASSTGLNAMPAPIPSSTIAGSTSIMKLPPTGARENSARLTAAISSPAASGGRMPKRITSRFETRSEQYPITMLLGMKARPTSSAS
jgi:hypothetical protein